MAERKQKPKETSFVSEVVKDPNAAGGVLLLHGFLGASAKEEHTRLYTDAGLGRFVEISNDHIRHVHDLTSDSAPLAGAYVWIDRDAELGHGGVAEDTPSEDNTQQQKRTHTVYTIPPYCPTASGQAGAIPTVPASQCLSIPIVCCPLPAGQGQGFSAQAYGGQAAQGAIPTVPASQCLSVPIVCCPLPAGQGQGFSAQAHGGQSHGAQSVIPTLPPFCGVPTVLPPTCLPPVCAGGAQATGQAAIPTIPASQCLSIPIVCC